MRVFPLALGEASDLHRAARQPDGEGVTGKMGNDEGPRSSGTSLGRLRAGGEFRVDRSVKCPTNWFHGPNCNARQDVDTRKKFEPRTRRNG